MGVFVKYDDFQGSYSFAVHGTQVSRCESEIDTYEKLALIKVFGVDMANDLLANPTTIENLKLIQSIHVCNLNSRGLKYCLLGFIYFELNRNAGYTGTSSGTKKVQQDLVMEVENFWQLCNRHYNDSVKDAKAMRSFVSRNDVDFPLFNPTERLLLNTPLV